MLRVATGARNVSHEKALSQVFSRPSVPQLEHLDGSVAVVPGEDRFKSEKILFRASGTIESRSATSSTTSGRSPSIAALAAPMARARAVLGVSR